MFAVGIPKSDGEQRELHIPALRDRIVERAIVDVIGPEVDREFIPTSFGYRQGLGVRDAVRTLGELRDSGLNWVVRTDIDDCFDELDRDRLIADLASRFDDELSLVVVRSLLDRPLAGFGRLRMTVRGAPQGGPPMTVEVHSVDVPDRRVFYVTVDGAFVHIESGQVIVSRHHEELLAAPQTLVGGMVIVGSVTISSGARSWALSNNVTVSFLSRRGQLQGWLRGPKLTTPRILQQQVSATGDPAFALEMARRFVMGKLQNCRVLMQQTVDRDRGERLAEAADDLIGAWHGAKTASSLEVLRGFEGSGSAAYFAAPAPPVPELDPVLQANQATANRSGQRLP